MKQATQQKIIGKITVAINCLSSVVEWLEDDTEFHDCDFLVDIENTAEKLAPVRGSIESILKNEKNSETHGTCISIANDHLSQCAWKVWLAIGELEIAMGNTRKHSIDLENAENCHKVLRKAWENLDWAIRRIRRYDFQLMPTMQLPPRSKAPRSG